MEVSDPVTHPGPLPSICSVVIVWCRGGRLSELFRVVLQCFDAVGWQQDGHPACKNFLIQNPVFTLEDLRGLGSV